MKKFLVLFILILFQGCVFAYNYNTPPDYAEIINQVKKENTEVEKIQNDPLSIEELTKLINFEKATTADSKMLSELYCARAVYYSIAKQTNNALQDYATALKYNPKNIEALEMLAAEKFKLKDYEGAILEMTKAIKADSKDFGLYNVRATYYLKAGKYNEVIADTTKSILIKNKNPMAFEVRGIAEVMQKNYQKGMQDLQFAKQQYFDLGDFDKYQLINTKINKLSTIIKKQK